MTILYIGDIMGKPGIEVVRRILPQLLKDEHIDFVVAQAENVTDGKGMSKEDFKILKSLGVDFFTGGNWTPFRTELHDYLSDPQQPVIRPANYPDETPGLGYKLAKSSKGNILVVSLLGQIVGKDSGKFVSNPLACIDEILSNNDSASRVATIVNFHGDYSSEKRIIGYYLDGRVSAVIGDHWHVPTADAMVLPKGTAHITDVGMCGSLHSSLGVKLGSVIPRWRDGIINKNELETEGPLQFNGVLITVDSRTSLSSDIKPIQKIIS